MDAPEFPTERVAREEQPPGPPRTDVAAADRSQIAEEQQEVDLEQRYADPEPKASTTTPAAHAGLKYQPRSAE